MSTMEFEALAEKEVDMAAKEGRSAFAQCPSLTGYSDLAQNHRGSATIQTNH